MRQLFRFSRERMQHHPGNKTDLCLLHGVTCDWCYDVDIGFHYLNV